jgi:tubulin-specific chaperone A
MSDSAGSALPSAAGGSAKVVETALDKQCRIKTSVVARLEKELQRYQEEVEKQQAKVDSMRASDADEYDVKKQMEVLGEAEMMVPDTTRRLQKAVEELHEFMTANRGNPGLLNAQIKEAAEAALARHSESTGAAAGGDDEAI